MRKCKLCGGHVQSLGVLGLLVHGKCRACGMMWSWPRFKNFIRRRAVAV